MESLILHLATSLVDHPEAVKVKVEETADIIHIQLSVASDDMGKIIGKHGRIANAIRVIAKAAGSVEHKKVYVGIVE